MSEVASFSRNLEQKTFCAPLIEDEPINGDKDVTPETSNSSRLGACPDCGHVMDAAAVEKYHDIFELIDTKANASSTHAFAMDVAEFCFRQMAKACRIFIG